MGISPTESRIGFDENVVPQGPADLYLDRGIRRRAEAAIRRAGLHGMVHVSCNGGRVSLHGCTRNDRERRNAEWIVRRIGAVSNVSNCLELADACNDADLRERIIAALRQDSALSQCLIRVDVSARTVILSGVVPSPLLFDEAEEIVNAIPGVKRLHCQLQVRANI